MGARAAMRPRVVQQPTSRSSLPKPNHPRLSIAVVGGGITGLTAAYRISRDPRIRVTLFEKSPRLGGWLQTERVKIPPPNGSGRGDGGEVLFEWGPRTLRAAGGMPTVELLSDLGLQDRIIHTPNDSPAASNRYILHRGELVAVPTFRKNETLIQNIFHIAKALRKPPFKGVLGSAVGAFFSSYRAHQDQSIGYILAQLMGPKIVDEVISAVYHGIYAGDVYNLSASSLAPRLFQCTNAGLERGQPSPQSLWKVFNGRNSFQLDYERILQKEKSEEEQGALTRLVQDTSMMTLKGGMQDIVSALKERLEAAPNVEICCNTAVTAMSTGNYCMFVKGTGVPQKPYDEVFTTVPPTELAKQIFVEKDAWVKDWKTVMPVVHAAVSVMVVNLYYHNPSLVSTRGFGYLIPRSAMLEGENPECALGVIFGSEVGRGQDTAPGTKLTVMLGGHWWRDIPEKELPSERDGIKMAQSILQRHLGITEQPAVAKAKLQSNAIPQYVTEHSESMLCLDDWLKNEFARLLVVGGGWYTGVGINDCISSARQTAFEIQGLRQYDKTGLQSYRQPIT